MPDQALARLGSGGGFEGVPHGYDCLLDWEREAVRRSPGCPGLVGQVGLGVAPVGGPPLVEPRQTAPQVAADIDTPLALQAATNRLAAQDLFGR